MRGVRRIRQREPSLAVRPFPADTSGLQQSVRHPGTHMRKNLLFRGRRLECDSQDKASDKFLPKAKSTIPTRERESKR